ncbi:hypothetical protein BRADI_2g05450v3 [Brachypodium distachyon]|uniref:Uncharacterized protein n=1 Tax=Brachypodium distachyon TaxID=15368 RepID=A0A0Q3QNP1_BRADI|nr:hypothetical protein BRADI_2g05450v3 [Brachypodium distachyon]
MRGETVGSERVEGETNRRCSRSREEEDERRGLGRRSAAGWARRREAARRLGASAPDRRRRDRARPQADGRARFFLDKERREAGGAEWGCLPADGLRVCGWIRFRGSAAAAGGRRDGGGGGDWGDRGGEDSVLVPCAPVRPCVTAG